MKKGFTLIELVFVIVVMGILAKFGTNILLSAYTNYTTSTVNNKILADTGLTLRQISNRLQYRIKSSVIVRTAPGAAFVSINSAGAAHRVIEWIGYDIDGWLGQPVLPTWSGFIDVNDNGARASAGAAGAYLESPGTNTNNITTTIANLANGSATTVADAAIFFTGANSDVLTDYGWNGTQNNQSITAAHSIQAGAQATQFADNTAGNVFTGTDIYENYKLAWTAYSISQEDFDGDGGQDLVLYYDYQPWNGGTAPANGNRQLLLQNVNTFAFRAVGDTINIQICVDEQDTFNTGDGGYSLCEEIAIF